MKIWITPPSASDPYRLENGPRTISTRSICSIGMSWIAAVPLVAEPSLRPSTSTSTWSDSVPRRNSEVCLPTPPLLAIDMPGVPLQKVGQRGRLQAIDLGAINHGDRGERLVFGLRRARRGDDDLVEVGGCFIGANVTQERGIQHGTAKQPPIRMGGNRETKLHLGLLGRAYPRGVDGVGTDGRS